MSQNKTVIQGLEPMDAPQQPNYGGAGSNPYARGGVNPYQTNAPRGTQVPEYMQTPRPELQELQQPRPGGRAFASGKPVVGFLYSVSRTAVGEYWPLHVGPNTIGQNPASDIVLPEATVSNDHAVLVVRRLRSPEKVIASINDSRSTNGTMLNGVSLGFQAEECKNGDIITIGDNYQMLLVLIDTAALGLSVAENFIPTQVAEPEPAFDPFAQMPSGGATRPEGINGGFYGGGDPYAGGGAYTPSAGTVGLDGSTGNNKGGTIGM